MKEEIKEILDKIKDGNWYEELDLTGTMWIELRWEETHLLLDYITNLQKENKIQKEKIQHLLIDLKGESEYKQRNEKAIEYINENKHLSMFADCREPEEDWNYDLEINPRELLDILKGGDDNE